MFKTAIAFITLLCLLPGCNKDQAKEVDAPVPIPTVVASAPVASYPPGASKENRALMEQADRVGELCHSESGDASKTQSYCDQLSSTMLAAEDAGWCWGAEAHPGIPKHWLLCTEDPEFKPTRPMYPIGRVDNDYVNSLRKKNLNKIDFSSDKARYLVEDTNLPCQNGGRTLPLINVILSHVDAANREKLNMRIEVVSRGEKIRITTKSLIGKYMFSEVIFDIDEFDISSRLIKKGAIMWMCADHFGPLTVRS